MAYASVRRYWTGYDGWIETLRCAVEENSESRNSIPILPGNKYPDYYAQIGVDKKVAGAASQFCNI
jgi:hypothetical protein